MLSGILFAIFAGLLGLFLCFWGYRLFMIMLPVWSFFGGLWLGAKGVKLLFGGGFLATTTGLTVGLILGIVLAIFSWQFYELGVAILGGVIGAWLGYGVMNWLGLPSGTLPVLVATGCGLVLGIVTLVQNWQQYLVMVLTAIAGANALVLSLLIVLGRVSMESLQGAGSAIRPILGDSFGWLFLWLGIAIAGVIVQARTYRRFTFVKQEFVKYWG
jgi:hypothetical protein